MRLASPLPRLLLSSCLLLWGLASTAMAASAAPATTFLDSVVCPGPQAGVVILTDANAIGCSYQPAPGFHPTHDGGPWLNVDLLHATLADLTALHNGTSGLFVYPNGPKLPPLQMVHAQICLSDPYVVYDHCPNNYPANPANLPYGYRLNPAIPSLLQQGLTRIRQAGLKVVLRFTYNYPCAPNDRSPRCNTGHEQGAPLEVILRHMQILAPTVQANSDVIYALQAGFIGRWGEWHNSTHDNDLPKAHDRFIDQYLALFRDYTNLEIRRPYVMLDYAKDRFGSYNLPIVLALGLGMHDDEFGSSASDGGTFLPEDPDSAPNPTPYSPCLLKQTTAALARAHTMTGETTFVYGFPGDTSCPASIPNPRDYPSFAAAYSLSTLQLVFAESVWRNWVTTGVYDGILRRIGPHLALISLGLSSGNGLLGRVSLTLTIADTGWAAIARPRPLWLLLRRGGETAFTLALPIDLRQVRPGKPLTQNVDLGFWGQLPAGSYAAYLLAPDASKQLRNDPRYALLFENQGVSDPATGLNLLATFSLSH